MRYDPNIHHRRSTRLTGYDYTQEGAYFLTIVTWQREEIFGAVLDGEMICNGLGAIAHQEWFRSAEIRKEIRLFEDEFVVMPNHIHGIVWIVNDPVGADTVRPGVGANTHAMEVNHPGATNKGAYHAPLQIASLRRKPKSLGSFVAGYKSGVAARAKREFEMSAVWQRNYYERIIRDEREHKAFWDYIDTNPLCWQDDQLHLSTLPNQ